MAKERLSLSIDEDVVSQVAAYNQTSYPGLSQSAVVEILLRDALSKVFLPGGGVNFIDVDIGGESRERITDSLGK